VNVLMAKIIAIVNQKGGVAKTTTTVNLGAALAMSEKRTLIVDMDPQANSTSGLGLGKYDGELNLYSCLAEGLDIKSILKPTELEYLKVAPSNKNLVGAEIELIDQDQREYRLKTTLAQVADDFDYILIDAPPSLGLLTINAMVAADQLLIPVQAEYYALEGVSELMDTMNRVKSSFNPALSIRGLLITMVDDRTNLSRQVEDEVRKAFGELVFSAVIPRNIRIAEAPSFGKPVLLYDVASKGASSYLKLAKEFLANG
jgi:chromosome partitioning protein